jgi:type I restriction enzyme, S subunit
VTAADAVAVDWLPTVKPGWELRPLWSMFERIKDTDHPDEQMLSVFRDYGVVTKDSRDNLNKTAENRSIYQLVHPGWLVTNRMKAWQGSVGISSLRGIVSGHYICFAPRHSEDSSYLNWLFRSPPYAHAYLLLSRGVRIGQVEIDNDDYRLLPVLLPPLDEQRAIVDYLDRETARIDKLVEEQQRLVGMLLERRQTAITVSTAGVQADVIQLVRCVTEQIDYRGATPPKTESGIQLVTARNVKAGWINYESSQEFIDPDTYTQVMRRGLPRTDDILFTMEAPLGNVALVDREDIALAQRIIKWTLDRDQAHPRYLLYAMLGDEFQHQLRVRSTGSTALGIKASKLSELRVRLPRLDEQRRIAAYLDEQTAKIDTLIAETERFIELSRERRSALITAAVTGQIDVRGEAA